MKPSSRVLRAAAALMVLVPLLVGGASLAGDLEPWESRALGWMMVARHGLGLDPVVDPRIVLVELDDATVAALGKPQILWSEDLAAACALLREAGCAAIALDFEVRPDLRKLPFGHSLSDLVLASDRKLVLQVQEGRLVLAGLVQVPGPAAQTSLSDTSLLSHSVAAGMGNLGYANLLGDPDGVVRKLPLLVAADPQEELPLALSMRLAELVTGREFRYRDGRLEWGETVVPTEHQAIYINYPGPPGLSYRRVSLTGLLQGSPRGGFEGTVCLIGATAGFFQDRHAVPFTQAGDGRLSPGVEIHAGALNMFLTGQFLRTAPGWWALLLPCLIAAAVAVPGLRLSAWARVAAGAGVLGLYLGVALIAFVAGSLILPLAGPVLAGLLSLFLVLVYRYLSEERSRILLRRIFSRYVSPQVARELLKDPSKLELGGARRRATFLFSDINDFTPTCEERSPEEVIAMLNAYFEEMVAIVFRRRGMVKQFVGDEIMAIFGAPEPDPEHAAQAVRAGLEMLERLEELATRGVPGFYDIKIGIHTGEVVVGNVGSEARTEYAAVGDDVNLAARIEATTKKLGVHLLVSEATYRECASLLPELEWTSQGDQSFKGKQATVHLYTPRRRAR